MLPSFPSGAIAGEYGCQKSPVALQKSPISLQKNFISLQKSPVSLQKSRLSLRKSPPSTPRHPREHSLRRQLGILWVSKEPHISQKRPVSLRKRPIHSGMRRQSLCKRDTPRQPREHYCAVLGIMLVKRAQFLCQKALYLFKRGEMHMGVFEQRKG